ncbi:phosphate starvation-inducible protein PhoH [Roseateles depolymerans]|uniref:PhoH-like protein n=1 Tax=Roseateles depolymerans TaxID=76731 RepID=A0A0U3E6D0_9BURK|nr:phosphate starvation protein PhoH [Roseateles depolymerans]REG09437.1 phosphate starvation-inducible protein PhoH [Roseateles depolymerans]
MLNPPEYGASSVLNLRHDFTPVDNHRLSHLCGTLDQHLRAIEGGLRVRISHRAEHFQIEGDKPSVQRTLLLLESLYARADRPIDPDDLRLAIIEAAGDVRAPGGNGAGAADGAVSPDGGIVLRTRRADLAGRTPNQHQYLAQILSHDISFGIGPAGTGKTFLAVACAVDALERSSVQRIILTRPAVEAGERLGFLPGDLAQKVDPYLRPLYDALYDLMGFDRVTKAFEKGQLEIAPLAFMRGRTLNHAFVILDEAQNTTPEQMKMFLTRIGFGSKCVVTGDTSQIDLPRGMVSGLVDAQRVLDGVEGIAMTRFTRADVVRHPLVARIVQAYEERQSARQLQEAREARDGAEASARNGAAPSSSAASRSGASVSEQASSKPSTGTAASSKVRPNAKASDTGGKPDAKTGAKTGAKPRGKSTTKATATAPATASVKAPLRKQGEASSRTTAKTLAKVPGKALTKTPTKSPTKAPTKSPSKLSTGASSRPSPKASAKPTSKSSARRRTPGGQ